MENKGAFPNGYYLEPSSKIGGLAEVVEINPLKQTSFPVNCRNLDGGGKKKKRVSKKKKRVSKKKKRKLNKSR